MVALRYNESIKSLSSVSHVSHAKAVFCIIITQLYMRMYKTDIYTNYEEIYFFFVINFSLNLRHYVYSKKSIKY